MTGVAGAADSVAAPVIGGDLSAGPAWVVAVTVLGRSSAPIGRRGAMPGDGIWVTGTLGGARAAVEAWRQGRQPSPGARRAFAAPVPQVAAGRWLAAHGARAMLDLSDGLAGDAAHLAAASGLALELELDAVPVAPDAADEARRLDLPASQFAAEGGEDYELLAALPPEFDVADATEFEAACGLALTRVGRAAAGSGVRAVLGGEPLALRGYDHFR
jgi:thiamine-monophosphate kinase